MKIKISISVILLLLFSCKKESKTENNETNPLKEIETEIKTISAMKKVMMGEDLSAHIDWDSIAKENLFAVCPMGRIQGEVTIVNGKMFTSKVNEKNEIVIENNWNIKSPFAVYAYVKSWHELEMNQGIANEDDLQMVVENAVKKLGLKTDKPFVFRIVGNFDKVDYHIISKPENEKEHNHDLHDKAKKHFSLNNVNGQLMGFYSKKHEGVFTHRGHYIHTHFIDDAETNMGHLEQVSTSKKYKVFISK